MVHFSIPEIGTLLLSHWQPIILGGIEASLRRIAHYDYWDDAVRRSILFDSKADILAYGMAEKTVIDLAQALKEGADWKQIKGICYISNNPEGKNIPLPSFEEISTNWACSILNYGYNVQ